MKTLSYTEEQNKIKHNVVEKKRILWFNFEKLYFDSLQEQEMVIIQRASYCHISFEPSKSYIISQKSFCELSIERHQWY